MSDITGISSSKYDITCEPSRLQKPALWQVSRVTVPTSQRMKRLMYVSMKAIDINMLLLIQSPTEQVWVKAHNYITIKG
ncbi:hypothetical protein Pcinc_007674 [Petrolisthes cinctipes]|uniref:Uncharacterized protein n=1 Tax=Petrolisthes cinctipes TaxID=88211 RepID=A0AAE1GAL1_PETCI|nr:hypothetical protein Pcinc_007674 [Petrolisthes cinctipes]